jgi:Spy/CpxP family protein refolding chaperone
MGNKWMKHGLVAALFLVGATPAPIQAQEAAPSSAQEQTMPAENAPNRPNLNLTDDQKTQMQKIREGAKSQIDAIKNDSSLSADQKQAKIRSVHQDSHKQVEAMLTPEQRKTMRQWRHEHRGEKQPQQPPSGN